MKQGSILQTVHGYKYRYSEVKKKRTELLKSRTVIVMNEYPCKEDIVGTLENLKQHSSCESVLGSIRSLKYEFDFEINQNGLYSCWITYSERVLKYPEKLFKYEKLLLEQNEIAKKHNRFIEDHLLYTNEMLNMIDSQLLGDINATN